MTEIASSMKVPGSHSRFPNASRSTVSSTTPNHLQQPAKSSYLQPARPSHLQPAQSSVSSVFKWTTRQLLLPTKIIPHKSIKLLFMCLLIWDQLHRYVFNSCVYINFFSWVLVLHLASDIYLLLDNKIFSHIWGWLSVKCQSLIALLIIDINLHPLVPFVVKSKHI